MLIYKISSATEWRAAEALETYAGAPVDRADGFIHFSTGAQVAQTAAKHFAGRGDLLLIAFDAEAMGEALKWETSRGGALFPHLHRALRTDEALWDRPLPLAPNGAHVFPQGVLS